MRRKRPQPKDRLLVSIPDDLREALREAWYLIQESEHDPDVRVDYGDAIQVDNLCGGRVGSERWPFEFTYYRKIEGSEECWYVAFHPLEIEDIVDGRMTEVMLHCCKTPGCGFKSRDPEDTCDCDWIDDPNFGTVEFPAAESVLQHWGVNGIDSSSTRNDVIGLLGEPTHVGGGITDRTIGYIYPFIKYDRNDCQLRFEFDDAGVIRNITVLDADWEPGK